MKQLEGIDLETTYTGKALAGLIASVREEQLYREPLLFWNTFSKASLAALGMEPVEPPATLRPYLA